MSLKFYVIGRERRRPGAAPRGPLPERRKPGGSSPHYIGIRDPRVSRRHAEVYVIGERVFLRDLGSKNGTYVLDRGRKVRLAEGYVRRQQLVCFGGCLRRMSKLLDQGGNGPGDGTATGGQSGPPAPGTPA